MDFLFSFYSRIELQPLSTPNTSFSGSEAELVEVNTEAHPARGIQISLANTQLFCISSLRRPSAATDFCIDIACAQKFLKVFHCKVRAVWSGHLPFENIFARLHPLRWNVTALLYNSLCKFFDIHFRCRPTSIQPNFVMKNFQRQSRTCYIDAKSS